MNFSFQYLFNSNTISIAIFGMLIAVCCYMLKYKQKLYDDSNSIIMMKTISEQDLETNQHDFFKRFPSRDEYVNYRNNLWLRHDFNVCFDFTEKYGDFLIQEKYEDEMMIMMDKLYLLMMMNKPSDAIRMIDEKIINKIRNDSIDDEHEHTTSSLTPRNFKTS